MRNWRAEFENLANSSRILALLYTGGGLTFGELVKESQLSKPTVSQHLKGLIRHGLVLQEGTVGDRRYVVGPEVASSIKEMGIDELFGGTLVLLIGHLPKKKRARAAIGRFIKRMAEKEEKIGKKREAAFAQSGGIRA